MASKMDKLRELKADNILTEEEMESVAGGQLEYDGWGADSRFLNVLLGGSVCDRYGDYNGDCHKREIVAAWAKVGVKLKEMNYSKDYGKRHYFIGNKEVLPREAYAHAMRVVGKHLEPSDWNW